MYKISVYKRLNYLPNSIYFKTFHGPPVVNLMEEGTARTSFYSFPFSSCRCHEVPVWAKVLYIRSIVKTFP